MSAGEYKPAVDPDQYAGTFRNVNPYSDQILSGLIPQLQGFVGQSLNQTQDPNQFIKSFLSSVPAFQGITTEATSELAKSQKDYLGQLTGQTISRVGGELSKIGGVNSSAFPRLVGEALAPEISALTSNLSAQRIGLFGGLAQTALPLFAQQQGQQAAYGLQAAGLLGGLGVPDLVAPDIIYEQSPWESIGQPLVNAAGGVLPLAFLGG